jgi:hypothetical protein
VSAAWWRRPPGERRRLALELAGELVTARWSGLRDAHNLHSCVGRVVSVPSAEFGTGPDLVVIRPLGGAHGRADVALSLATVHELELVPEVTP